MGRLPTDDGERGILLRNIGSDCQAALSRYDFMHSITSLILLRRAQFMTPYSISEWESMAGRVNWLLDDYFSGNRSHMGKALGMTHAAVSRAASGRTMPSTKMTTAIVQKLGVSSEWLLSGRGEPYKSGRNRDVQKGGIPIAKELLAGLPKDLSSKLSAANLGLVQLLSPTQYWATLEGDSPLLNNPRRRFQPRDLLLIEADATRFPAKHEYSERLCVIHCGASGGRKPMWADVCYHAASIEGGKERLEADVFKGQGDEKEIEEIVLRLESNGGLKAHRRTITLTFDGKVSREKKWYEQANERTPQIKVTDIVGVWTGIMYRPYSTGLGV